MRYAMIMAGGSGTRLWPMSRARQPKQLIPFIHGKSLLELAVERLRGMIPEDRILICAGEAHREAIFDALPGLSDERFFGEPTGRDTLNAVGYVSAVLAERDQDATLAVFTADHVIEPVQTFQQTVEAGYRIAEQQPQTLVTFGITPTHAATGYGYLELGEKLQMPSDAGGARQVQRFKEKPDAATAAQYLDAGPGAYLWNSGMFVWRAAALMRAIEKFSSQNHAGLAEIARDPSSIERVYPELKKISIDFAVMEPASTDEEFAVAAVPMDLTWLDVGSWPSFAQTCETDEAGNALGGGRHLLLDSRRTLVASSEPDHLIATIGAEDLIVIHTPDATLVCPRDRAEEIKKLHGEVGERFGEQLL